MGCDLESRELMSLCLNNVSGLKQRRKEGSGGKVRLVDAVWVWTEPHSMRLKVSVMLMCCSLVVFVDCNVNHQVQQTIF
jgi:nonsense-mediated mRNA decay protein 3